MNPQFPVYVVSKGRADIRKTMNALERMGVPFRAIVEAQEADAYAAGIGRDRVLVLDPEYQRTYDAFSDLGATATKGSGPARNFAWDHSLSLGAPWHWVMDDNIHNFYRLNRNTKIAAGDGTFFRCMEDFVLRYSNVRMAGPQYEMFCPSKNRRPPFVVNTRVYSCNLIRNDLPFRWRGRYNEDTDLSLRILKAGFATILFNAFLQDKIRTLALRGGNTEAVYARGQFSRAKSQMLVDMHPDVARLTHRFSREHHYVDYSGFRFNPLGDLAPGAEELPAIDNYGLEIVASGKRPMRRRI